MEEGHIYLYGEIVSFNDEDAESYGLITPKSVRERLDSINSDTITVHINSPGGHVDAGFAIYDILKTSGKTINTRIEGQCYSIATVVFLAGERREATANSEFLIHNPWTPWSEGDAEALRKHADQLETAQNKLAQFYSDKTGVTLDGVLEEMKKDDFMSLDQAKEYGFITDIIDTVKAVAKFKPKTEMAEKKEAGGKDLWNKIAALLNQSDDTKNIILKAADDTEIDFYEREEGNPEINDKATVGGEDASGDYLMPDGSTYSFEAGVLTAIAEAEQESEEESEEVANLKKQVADLEAKLGVQSEQLETVNKSMKEYTSVFSGLKALVSENVVDDKTPQKREENKNTSKGLFGGHYSKDEK